MQKKIKKTLKKVPGFRTGKWWKQLLAVIVYVAFTIFTILALLQSIIFAGISLSLFLFSIIFLFDLDDIWLRLRFPKNDPMLRYFIMLVFVLLAFSLWFVLVPRNFVFETVKTINSFVGAPIIQSTPAPFDFPGAN